MVHYIKNTVPITYPQLNRIDELMLISSSYTTTRKPIVTHAFPTWTGASQTIIQ